MIPVACLDSVHNEDQKIRLTAAAVLLQNLDSHDQEALLSQDFRDILSQHFFPWLDLTGDKWLGWETN